jgi:hypothetical protein
MTTSEKQRERRQRGEDFQDEIRRSWPLVPNSWRLRIADAGGGTRPADEITLLPGCNILAEMKRTTKPDFWLNFLRSNQIKGLLDFERVLDRNYGLVYVSFNRPNTDKAYAFRLSTAIKYMQREGRRYIFQEELTRKLIPNIPLPRIQVPVAVQTPAGIVTSMEPGYDLRGLHECYRLL